MNIQICNGQLVLVNEEGEAELIRCDIPVAVQIDGRPVLRPTLVDEIQLRWAYLGLAERLTKQ